MTGKLINITVALVMALMLGACHRAPDPEAMAARYASELRTTDRLQLASMTIGKMATVADTPLSEARTLRQSADALIDKLKIGSRVAAYSFNTTLTAYIDLSTIAASDFRFSPDGKEVAVTLPRVKTTFDGRDFEMREEHYRVTGMRSQVNAPERARLKQQMTEDLIEDIRKDPTYSDILIEKAQAKAEAFFTDLFAARGIKATVSFR